MRTSNTFIQHTKSSTKYLIANSCAFPTTIYQIPSKTFSTSCFRIFKMSKYLHRGWKVLNCLTNTTEILGKKGKHRKLGFLFKSCF